MMKKLILLSLLMGHLKIQCQTMKWEWAIGNTVCLDTVLHYSDAGSISNLAESMLSPTLMELDSAGNIYVFGFCPNSPMLTKYPIIFGFNTAQKTEIDYHYSGNRCYLMKIDNKGKLLYSKIIAGDGIPDPTKEVVLKVNPYNQEVYLAYNTNKANFNYLYIGDDQVTLPNKNNGWYMIILDANGKPRKEFEILDAGGTTNIRKILFPNPSKVYIVSEAKATSPDFVYKDRLTVFSTSGDSIVKSIKFSVPIIWVNPRNGNLCDASLNEFSENNVKLSSGKLPETPVDIYLKRSGNYVIKFINKFTFEVMFAEYTPAGKLVWNTYQKGTGKQFIQLDADDNAWIFFGLKLNENTSPYLPLGKGFSSPYMAMVDTTGSNKFVKYIVPTNLVNNSFGSYCFRIHKRDMFIAGNYVLDAEFGNEILNYRCNNRSLPLNYYIAKATPGWEQTRKNLSKNVASKIDYSVFPNPSLDFLNIQGLENKSSLISIYKSDGTCVIKNEIYKTGGMDVKFLSSGVYTLVISDSNQQTIVLRFVKM